MSGMTFEATFQLHDYKLNYTVTVELMQEY